MKQLRNSLSSYARFIHWLLHDSLWRKRGLTSAVLASGVIGVGFQGTAFGVVVFYVRHFSAGESINLAGYAVDPRASMALLGGESLAVVALLSLSALCIYYSRRAILRMGREYEEYCAKRVFRSLGKGGDLFSSMEGRAGGERYLLRLVRSDSRLAGRVLRMLLSLVIPGVTLVVAVVVLIYLEAALSLAIAILGGVLFFYQYRVSRRAAQHSIRFEQLAPAAGAEYHALIQHCKYLPQASAELAEPLFAGGPVKKQLDAHEGRLRAVENSRLVSGLFTAVVLGLIILIMGGGIIREGAGWGRLLVYVGALRFAMVNLQAVFSAITAINRFYPQVRRYSAFVRSLAGQDRARYPARDAYTLEVDHGEHDDILEGSVPRLEVTRGMCLALVSPLELNRYTLAAFCESLLGSDEAAVYSALYAARYAGIGHSCPNTSLRSALGLPDEAQWDDLRAYFPDDERWQQAREQLPKSLDKPIKPRQWEQVAPELKFALSLISARLHGCSWIFLQAEGLQRLGAEASRFYLELFNDAVNIVVHNGDLDLVGAFDEDAVAVADEDRLLGLGNVEWFRKVQEGVAELMPRKGKAGKEARGDVLEDECLEE